MELRQFETHGEFVELGGDGAVAFEPVDAASGSSRATTTATSFRMSAQVSMSRT
jgi:hypothetical protein